MKWETKIADSTEEGAIIRGYDLDSLMEKKSFSEVIFLLLAGKLPTAAEAKMLNAILVSTIDHGIAVPSITAARTAFSGGSPVQAAVAAGILAIGDYHGGAGEAAAKMFQENKGKTADAVVKDYVSGKKRVPGYGHRIYKDQDPRAQKLLAIAKKLNISSSYCELAAAMEKELKKATGKQLPLNVDGATAAILSDMGLDWKLAKGIFIISRTPGIVAHVNEEWETGSPVRRLEKGEYKYSGEKGKR